jgi:hypothetical protein
MAQASLQVPQPEHFSWMTVGIMDDAPLKMVDSLTFNEKPNDVGFSQIHATLRRADGNGGRPRIMKANRASPSVNETFQSLCQAHGFFQPIEMKEKASFYQAQPIRSKRTELSSHPGESRCISPECFY